MRRKTTRVRLSRNTPSAFKAEALSHDNSPSRACLKRPDQTLARRAPKHTDSPTVPWQVTSHTRTAQQLSPFSLRCTHFHTRTQPASAARPWPLGILRAEGSSSSFLE